jgi:hypothetical protein
MVALTKCLLITALLMWPSTSPAQVVVRAKYVGGTLSTLPPKVSGAIRTSNDAFVFVSKGATQRIPYEQINLLEYGQTVSRRYILAILISPVFLLCKTRAHFVTIGYSNEEGQQSAMVLRVDKRAIRSTLAALEARTGLKMQYLDDEARRVGPG